MRLVSICNMAPRSTVAHVGVFSRPGQILHDNKTCDFLWGFARQRIAHYIFIKKYIKIRAEKTYIDSVGTSFSI